MTCSDMTSVALSSPLVLALDLIPPRCLVGVSGGIDSVVLLQALVAAGKQPVVLHFDHGWRGATSTRDAEFVRALAKKWKLKCVVGKARASVKKTEQSARAARWEFFAKAAAKLRCHDLLLAHNADDQVETFLLQLLRGGGSGARGMRALSKRGALNVHRPWLGTWRKEITAYAKENKLRWREDATNRDTHHRRNWLRHRLMPLLQKQISPDAPKALWRAAEILGAEGDWLEELTARGPSPTSKTLPVRALRALPVAHLRRLLRAWLSHHGIVDISFEDIEAVRGLLTQTLPAKINLSGGCFARRRDGSLFLEAPSPRKRR